MFEDRRIKHETEGCANQKTDNRCIEFLEHIQRDRNHSIGAWRLPLIQMLAKTKS
jgi:hypothetical protein